MLNMHLPDDTVHEHIALFTKAPRMIYLGHIASAGVLIYLASNTAHTPLWFLLTWACVELAGTPVAMGWLAHNYNRDTDAWSNKQTWIAWLDILFLFIGISWGTMLLVSLNPDNPVHFSMQIAIAAGASSAAVKSLGLFPRTFALYAVPFLGLLATRLFVMGGDYILLGGLVLIFLVMLLGLSKDALVSIQQYIEIKHENLKLAEQYRIAAERADHANREKTRLLAAASHDLRQPVHAIGLHLETLSKEDYNEQDRNTINRIGTSIKTLTKLFNSVLDVSLLDAGKIAVNSSTIPARGFIQSVTDDFQAMARIAGTSISFDIPDISIFCDPDLLRRKVQNLISNAIRYGGGTPILVSAQQDNQFLTVSVQDFGPGISKDNQALIFEEFTHMDQQTNGTSSLGEDYQQKGLGLGLAIVKRLAKLQGIRVDLQSDAEGTSFRLHNIPISKTNALRPAQGEKPSLPGSLEGRLVVIVDDDQQSLQATSDLLQHWGCKTITTTGPLDVLEGHSLDLLICDYELTDGKTGLSVVTEVEAMIGHPVKSLIISGNSSPDLRQSVEDAGLLFISKPVQPAQLRSALLSVF